MGKGTRNWRSLQVGLLRRQFAQGSGLPFSEVLSADLVKQVLDEVGGFFRQRIFTPLTTLWVFLSQVTSPDGSCRDAVIRLLALRASRRENRCSAGTGSYCKARQRLPEEVLSRLTQETGAGLTAEAPTDWRWKGREVKIVDGTTLSMPDNAWEAKVEIIRQFISRCGANLGSSVQADQPHRYAQDYQQLIRSYVDSLRSTSSMFRRL